MLSCPDLRMETASSSSWVGSPTSFLTRKIDYRLLACNYAYIPVCIRLHAVPLQMALKASRMLRQLAVPIWRHAINLLQWMSASTSVAVNGGGRRFEDMPTERGSSWLFGVGPELLATPLPKFYEKAKDKHGRVFRLKVFPGKYMVIVADVDGAETVVRNEGRYPSRGGQFGAMKLVIELHSKRNSDSPGIAVSAA